VNISKANAPCETSSYSSANNKAAYLACQKSENAPKPAGRETPCFAKFEPLEAERGRFHQREGIEFTCLLSGTLELRTEENRHELREGDAIYFDCSVPYGYRRIGSRRTTALVVACLPKNSIC
jgi:hypothetical protein